MLRTLPSSPVETSEPQPDSKPSAGIDAQWLHEQSHLSLIIDSAPNGMILVNGDGVIELINKQVEIMFGYQRSELLGESVELLLPERSRKDHPGLRREYHHQPSARGMGVGRDLFGRRSDGSAGRRHAGDGRLRGGAPYARQQQVIAHSDHLRDRRRAR